MNYSYVPINRIFSKLIRDTDTSIVEGDIIEWCGEALEFIGANKYYEEAVAFVEVKNHQCSVPDGTHNIIQIARNNKWHPALPKEDPNCPCPTKVINSDHHRHTPFVQEKEGQGCCDTTLVPYPKVPDYIVLDCNGQPINDYDLAYYRPYFDLRYEYDFWRSNDLYTNCYTPVRLKTGSFFNSLVCDEKDNQHSSNLHSSSSDEYTIIQNTTIRFSFREGSVAIAFNRQVIDLETGYPLIPDNISYTTAITKYITMKIFEREFYRGRDGAKGKLDKAEQDWHWYCKQASNVDMMPHGIDEYQNLLDQRSYILPRQNRYFGFFGNLAKPEVRKYNDPDQRNREGFYYRGS